MVNLNIWIAMKNLENTLKTQENQPEAMKYHENASGNHDKKKHQQLWEKYKAPKNIVNNG